MVRINLVDPALLADQHLVAEYDEILMLLGSLRKCAMDKGVPKEYCLGKGHIKFFRNKLGYLKKRHERLKKEMRRRGFRPTKSVDLKDFDPAQCNDWRPSSKDIVIIKSRISKKIRRKPGYYRYCGEHRPVGFFIELIERAK